MCEARHRTREDNWRDVDRGWRGLPARLRPPSLLGVLGCVACRPGVWRLKQPPRPGLGRA
jgi:hypothetical protein